MVYLTAVTEVEKKVFWWLLHNIETPRWWENLYIMLTEIVLLRPIFTEESFHVDFLEKEIVVFDENLAVVSWCDVQQCGRSQ